MKKKAVDRHPRRRVAAPKSAELEITVREFHHHPKDQFWYVGVGLLLTAVAVGLAWTGNYLLTVVVVALGLAVFRLANVHPQTKSIRLTASGLYWGDQFFGFHQFKGFWLSETDLNIAFYLERPNLAPLISFIVPTPKADELILMLSHQLPHHYHKGEPLSDRLSRLARF